MNPMPLPATVPDLLIQVPVLEACSPEREIRRSVDLMQWLGALPDEAFVHDRPPRSGADLISVVLPMYNASDWIALAVKSILAQTHRNVELFCVDDASGDDTYAQVCERFGRDRRVCVLRLRRNVGPYQIKNWVSAHLARGPLLAFQDADDYSHPTRLSEQRAFMRRTKSAVCGTCVHQFFPPDMQPRRNQTAPVERAGYLHTLAFYSTQARITDPVPLHELLHGRPGFRYLDEQGTPVQAANHGSLALYSTQMLYRRTFLAFGGFDGRTRFEADKEFNWRVARCGAIGNLPQVLYSRRFHRDSLTQAPATGWGSPARQRYIQVFAQRQERIRQAIEAGDWEAVHARCTSDLYCGDLDVADVHSGFDVPTLT